MQLAPWAQDLITLYESQAANQFILHGNVNDLQAVPTKEGGLRFCTLEEYLQQVLLPSYDVVLTYDLGNGLRVLKGQQKFAEWPSAPKVGPLPRPPREAVDLMTHYIRYASNARRVKGEGWQVAFILRDVHMAIPALQGGLNYDLNAMALLVKEWSTETLITEHPFVSFLITENLMDLHPLLVNEPRLENVKITLPSQSELERVLPQFSKEYPTALKNYVENLAVPAGQMAGASLVSIASLLKTKEHQKLTLADKDLTQLKKELVEKDCNGLIEFIEPTKTLDDIHGQEGLREWLRQDFALWRAGELSAMPMGYLLCGPVGTGKTYMIECLAGEAGVPVVKMKNFRDKWVGSTEGNLEKIFRLIGALGRCFVFIDEADQALGKRNADGDSGVGGRVYSMMAKEMSDTSKRGKVVWVLASSRPDLIEVDLKRPGRVDVKIPLFPTTTPEEGFGLIRALCKKKGVPVPAEALEQCKAQIPEWLTPGAAEALAVKVYRSHKTKQLEPTAALEACLKDYQAPVARDIMEFQIEIAAKESTDRSFVPEPLRKYL
jgi:AAA+ superfamily predicted ATPase